MRKIRHVPIPRTYLRPAHEVPPVPLERLALPAALAFWAAALVVCHRFRRSDRGPGR